MAHGGWLLFGWVLLDQVGLPVPAMPALLGAGVLARSGRMGLVEAVAIAMIASIIGHAAWYEAGRRRGRSVLRWICRISLEPDACVRRGENFLARGGTGTLILVHFVPGLGPVAQPLAALAGVKRARYLGITALGAFAWAATFTGLGYAFGDTLLHALRPIGTILGIVLGAAFVAYLGWKLIGRYRLLADMRVARIAPEDLARLVASGAAPFIVDMRHPAALAGD